MNQKKKVELKAIDIINSLDSNSIKELQKWNFFYHRGADAWTRISDDSALYRFWYYTDEDTNTIRIAETTFFTLDFQCNFDFKLYNYEEFDLENYNDSIVRIKGRINSKILAHSTIKNLFPKESPFKKTKMLEMIISDFGTYAISGDSKNGYLRIFLSNKHILTYLPDSTKLTPKLKNLLHEPSANKVIKPNWYLQKLDRELDNG